MGNYRSSSKYPTKKANRKVGLHIILKLAAELVQPASLFGDSVQLLNHFPAAVVVSVLEY